MRLFNSKLLKEKAPDVSRQLIDRWRNATFAPSNGSTKDTERQEATPRARTYREGLQWSAIRDIENLLLPSPQQQQLWL
jgi:hypothetical protein